MFLFLLGLLSGLVVGVALTVAWWKLREADAAWWALGLAVALVAWSAGLLTRGSRLALAPPEGESAARLHLVPRAPGLPADGEDGGALADVRRPEAPDRQPVRR